MRRIETWTDLEKLVHVTTEGADLDFKARIDPSGEPARIECAKDVAALANVLGGHVLVGASTDTGGTRCTGFHGISRDAAAAVLETFERQVRDRCRPTPALSVHSIAIPDSDLVVGVVAVQASPAAPVGVSLSQKSGGTLVDRSWAFPYRVGSQTGYLSPDQFGAYESMSARRAAALLQGIPEAQRDSVALKWAIRAAAGGVTRQHAQLEVKLEGVDLAENVAFFYGKDDPTRHLVSVPLDAVLTVWKDRSRHVWHVSIRGVLNNNGTPRYEYGTVAGE